jgi:hypothetical protein
MDPSIKETLMMKKILSVLFDAFFVMTLCMGTLAYAAEEAVDITWSLENVEPDVQYFRLYVNDTDDFSTATQLGEDMAYNPNGGNEVFQFPSMSLTIPDDQDVTKYFWVTAVDTSGNECGPGYTHQKCIDNPPEMVAVQFDNLPPLPPTGLTVTARVIITTQ